MFDFTDSANAKEIAYFDRGPLNGQNLVLSGYWSTYWYNGHIYGAEIARGIDVFRLKPSEFISQNELDAAKTVHMDYLNAQGQPKFVWPPSFALARAYVDQLERSKCLSSDRISSVRQALSAAERAAGSQRKDALTTLATALDGDARNSCDGRKVGKLSEAVRNLANVAT
jgi:hypothetical protein